jgi:hypothetical protein
MTALAILVRWWALLDDLIRVAASARLRFGGRKFMRSMTIGTSVVPFENGRREFRRLVFFMARHAARARLPRMLVRLMTVFANELLGSPGRSVLDVLLGTVAGAAFLWFDPRLLMRLVAGLARHTVVNVDNRGSSRGFFAVTLETFPSARSNIGVFGEVVTSQTMRLRHFRNRYVNVLMTIIAALGDGIAEAFYFAEVATGATGLRLDIGRNVMAYLHGPSAPRRIFVLGLVTCRAAGVAGRGVRLFHARVRLRKWRIVRFVGARKKPARGSHDQRNGQNERPQRAGKGAAFQRPPM